MTTTSLALAARNMLVQLPEVKELIDARKIGRGTSLFEDGWIFADKPYTTIEKYSNRALIVVTESGGWSAANGHNTLRFPRLYVDIWASPTRNSDGSVKEEDADDLIREIMRAISPYLHLVHGSVPSEWPEFFGKPGESIFWGNAEEIAAHDCPLILGSERQTEPVFSDVAGGDGARMATYVFNVTTIN
jgi:hypothetical protein